MSEFEQNQIEEGKIKPLAPELSNVSKKQVILLELDFYKELMTYLSKKPAGEASSLFLALAQAKPQTITFQEETK